MVDDGGFAPFILYRQDNDQQPAVEMARINADASWTVDWSMVDQFLAEVSRKEIVNASEAMMRGIVMALVAGKDNLRTVTPIRANRIARTVGKAMMERELREGVLFMAPTHGLPN